MIRLLIADDSAFMRIAIRKLIDSNAEIVVVGEAKNGQMCVDMANSLRPDVITMDVNMPLMDGLDATRIIMNSCPTPIIMLSSLTESDSEITLKALEYGAVDFVAKKSSFVELDLVKIGEELLEKLVFWGNKKDRLFKKNTRNNSAEQNFSLIKSYNYRKISSKEKPKLVVLACSTGGPAALSLTLKSMKPLQCPMVIAQHMPSYFTKGFANHLKDLTDLNVVEGVDGMELSPGIIVIIKGGSDAVVVETTSKRLILRERTDSTAFIHPNADILFESVSRLSCTVAVVIMTGMGNDGTRGAEELVSLKECHVLVQEPSTCIIDSMPNSVIERKLASEILIPEQIGVRLTELVGYEDKTKSGSYSNEKLVKKKIFIVDDSKVIRDLLKRIISGNNCFTVTGEAKNGLEALSKINQNQPDLILLDIDMPLMDGIEFLGELRQTSNIPVIVITSLALDERRLDKELLELGISGRIAKPSGELTLDINSITAKEIVKLIKKTLNI